MALPARVPSESQTRSLRPASKHLQASRRPAETLQGGQERVSWLYWGAGLRACLVTAAVLVSVGFASAMELEDLLDLLTYTCPQTGRKRCAVDTALNCASDEALPKQKMPKKEVSWTCNWPVEKH